MQKHFLSPANLISSGCTWGWLWHATCAACLPAVLLSALLQSVLSVFPSRRQGRGVKLVVMEHCCAPHISPDAFKYVKCEREWYRRPWSSACMGFLRFHEYLLSFPNWRNVVTYPLLKTINDLVCSTIQKEFAFSLLEINIWDYCVRQYTLAFWTSWQPLVRSYAKRYFTFCLLIFSSFHRVRSNT